jgi:hypothetical protein
MIAMFERLDEFARTLPEPRFGGDWDACYGQHVRNAERMRAEAFKYALFDLGRGLRAGGRKLVAGLGAIRGRAEAGLAQSHRPADAWRGGAD